MSKKLLIACAIMMTLLFIMTRWQDGKIDDLKRANNDLSNQLSRKSLISDNAYTSISIFDRISGATIDAKQQNTLDAQGTKKDVKTILVGNDCAPVTAPDSLINRMRQYKD
ncbi:hypothetical protein [Moellerella wisconsensis]|uniref:Uncharacterized protein n=1 Tax=Moellerella wisconsensis TaxID=158849 RepID=A0A9Q8Q5F2_9GAMM|nr:hypothetical protein [Moellerella wisconsensis]UNH32369.1 hypothetical protein MNY72_12090 [Moellerella wisconsensis]